jgi:hypothetical protein
MAVQKNFVVRNGLEVNNNLLVADSSTDHVGVGTSSPKYTLEVIGGIGVTYVDVLGIGTVVQEFNVGTGGTVITSLNTGLTGFGTQSPAYIVDIRSPVSTGQTALYVQGDVRVTGDLYADDISFDQATLNNLEVTGVGTIATASIDLGYVKTGIVTNLSTSGIGTIETASINLGYVNTGIVTNLITSGIGSITIAAIRDGYINTGIVTNLVTTGIASIATGVVTNAYVTTGIVTNLVTSGIGSITTAAIDTGYVTTGIVTNLTTTGIASIATGVVTDAYITTGVATNFSVSGIATIQNLDVQNDFDIYATTATFHDNVIIEGNLTVNGTETIINTTTLAVQDKEIILGIGTTGSPSDASASGGGVSIASTEGNPLVDFTIAGIHTHPNTYKDIVWIRADDLGVGTTDAWHFNYAVGIGSTQIPNGTRFAVSGIQFTDTAINTPNLTATGIVTANEYTINGTTVVNSSRELQNIASLDATTTATIEAAIANAPNTFQDIEVTGIATVNVGVFTSLYTNTGIITTLSGANIDYSGIGTFGTISVDLGYVKTGVVTNLITTGIASIATGIVTNLTVSGFVTATSFRPTSGYYQSANGTNSFYVYDGTGNVSFQGTIGVNQINNGSGYKALEFSSSTTPNVLVTNGLEVSGLSTVANFRITPIGSGATVGNSGIVTYYGDGSQLSNIISGVGIQSAGTLVGTGFTTLNFIGAGNTFAVNGTTIDISISGGAGAGGTWTTYNAGIATSKSVGVHTSTIDEPNLTGVGNSFNGLYVANGMIIVDNQLNGDHYIGTSYNGLMAGPVTVNGVLTVDGNYVVV